MKELPEFEKRPRHRVMPLMQSVFANSFVRLLDHADGHYRVIFDGSVFTMAEGQLAPSASQWTTLKKKLKRRDRRVFVFRAHGTADCERSLPCYYMDFGFFLHD